MDFKFHISGWFGVRIENLWSNPPKEVRGQSWLQRSLQKHVEMTPTKRGQRLKLTSEVTSKTCQNDFKFHISRWSWEVRGQSWPRRSLQKHVKMTSNCILVDGLGWCLRLFNLTQQKRSKAKVDPGGHFKNMSKWLQIRYLWMVWDDIQDYSIWPTKRGQRPKLTSEVTSKTCQNDFKLHTCGWFGMIFENIQSDLPKEVRGQSWPWRSLQKMSIWLQITYLWMVFFN